MVCFVCEDGVLSLLGIFSVTTIDGWWRYAGVILILGGMLRYGLVPVILKDARRSPYLIYLSFSPSAHRM